MKKFRFLSFVVPICMFATSTVTAMHNVRRYRYHLRSGSSSSSSSPSSSPHRSPSSSPSTPHSCPTLQCPSPLYASNNSPSTSHSPSPAASPTITEQILLMKRQICTPANSDIHAVLEDFQNLIDKHKVGEHAKEDMKSIIEFFMEFLTAITDNRLNTQEASDLGHIIFSVAGIPEDIVPDELFSPMYDLGQYLISKRD